MVKTEPEKFVARDGREFEDKAAAERWDAVVEATDKLQEAGREWEIAAMETAITADGKPFKVNSGRLGCDYWMIYGGYDSAARVGEVRFSPRDVRLSDSDWRADVEIEYVWTDPWRGVGHHQARPDERLTARVDELWSSKAAAEAEAYRMDCERVTNEYASLVERAKVLGIDPPPLGGTT